MAAFQIYDENSLNYRPMHHKQGSHCTGKTGKTGKMVKSNSRQGKHREFENFGKTQGKRREFENFRIILKSESHLRSRAAGRDESKITDCVILHIKSTGKNVNFTGKTQGKHREFKFKKAVGNMCQDMSWR